MKRVQEAKTCPVCVKPVTHMVDYPFVRLSKVEFPDKGIINGFNDDDNDSCREIWAELSLLPETQNYLKRLESCIGKKVGGKTLLPFESKSSDPWERKLQLPVSEQELLEFENFSKHDRAIALMEGRPRTYFLAINDTPWIPGENSRDFIDFIDGHAQVVIWKSGGFSREGPALNSVGVIADLYYDGMFR